MKRLISVFLFCLATNSDAICNKPNCKMEVNVSCFSLNSNTASSHSIASSLNWHINEHFFFGPSVAFSFQRVISHRLVELKLFRGDLDGDGVIDIADSFHTVYAINRYNAKYYKPEFGLLFGFSHTLWTNMNGYIESGFITISEFGTNYSTTYLGPKVSLGSKLMISNHVSITIAYKINLLFEFYSEQVRVVFPIENKVNFTSTANTFFGASYWF